MGPPLFYSRVASVALQSFRPCRFSKTVSGVWCGSYFVIRLIVVDRDRQSQPKLHERRIRGIEMRKVTFGGANSLDNFIARPDHSYDWLLWSDEVTEIMKEFWP